MEEQNMQLVQKPVIIHKLLEVGKNVSERLAALNIDKLVANEDTVKSLKQLRADLNNEYTEFESQRKALKEAVAAPYMEFETLYKSEIQEKYKNASELLKDKITDVENRVKTEKKNVIVSYFNELCMSKNIDFLVFANTGIEINLSTSLKQYKEKCNEFVERVSDDVILINGTDYPAETMTEYKSNSFSASKAITSVRDRKEAERLEADRIKTAETNRRVKMLQSLAMVYHDITRSYSWVQDESLFIDLKDVENLSAFDFQKEYNRIEHEITLRTKPVASAVVKPTIKPEQVLQAPVEVKEPVIEKKVKAAFECEGTRSQLIALGQYMKDNGITYKNI